MTAAGWGATIAFIVGLFALDLLVSGRRQGAVGFREAVAIPEIGTYTSLAIIVVILLVATVASVIKTRRDPSMRAHAGSLRGHHEETEAQRKR